MDRDGRSGGEAGDGSGSTTGGNEGAAGASSSIFRAIFASSGVLALGLAFHLGLGFLGRLIVARFLGRVDYGAVALGFTLLTTASILVVLGTDKGVGRYLPRFDADGRRRGVLVSALQVVVPLSVLLGLLVALLAGPIARYAFTDPSIEPVVRVFGLAIPLAAIVRLTLGSTRGMQETVPRVAIDDVALPLTRFSLIAAAVFLGFGAVGVAWAYAGGFAVAAAASIYYLARRTPLLEPVETTTMRRDLLAFSAPLMVTATMNMVHSNLDNFVLGYFASTGEVGVYNVAYPLAQLLTVLLTAFGFLFMPIVSELHAEGRTAEIVRTYHVVSKWTVLAALPLFLVLVTFPRAVIGATFGPEYAAGGLALAILAVGFFVHVGSGPTGISLTSFGLTRRIMYFNTSTAVANAALNLALVPRFSYVGAAVATTAGYVVMNALFMVQFHREVGTHPFRGAMLRPAFAAIAVWAGLALVLYRVAPSGLAALLATLALFLPAYAVVVVRFGGVEQEEVDLLGSLEDRFDVDLGPARRVASRLAG